MSTMACHISIQRPVEQRILNQFQNLMRQMEQCYNARESNGINCTRFYLNLVALNVCVDKIDANRKTINGTLNQIY